MFAHTLFLVIVSHVLHGCVYSLQSAYLPTEESKIMILSFKSSSLVKPPRLMAPQAKSALFLLCTRLALDVVKIRPSPKTGKASKFVFENGPEDVG